MVPQTLVNMNLFVDGKGYGGLATSLTLPKLKIKTDEHRAGGMDAPIKMDLGMEVLDASFVMSGLPVEVLKLFGLADQTAFAGTFRGAAKDTKGKVVAAVATLRGMLEEVDSGDWKPGEKAEMKFALSPSYYKLEIDGRVIFEIDPVNCIRVVNGVDQLEEVRKAIGL